MTGGAGFVGSHVSEYYARRGDTVTVIDNLSRARMLGGIGDSLYNWNYLKSFENVELIQGDVRDFGDVKKASEEVNTIVHAAAQVAVTKSLEDPRTDFDINAVGTFNVLEAARARDADLIYCSTNKVYGTNVDRIPVSEGSERYAFADDKFENGIPENFPIDLCNHSPYGCSKLAGDLFVQDYAETYGLRTAVFRMSCIYGERQFGVEDQGWVAWFVIATITGSPITIYGDGKQVRDVLYVSDLVDAFQAFIRSKVKHDVFNIGGGRENTLSLLELLDLLEMATGKKPRVSFSNWRQADQKVYISDISKAQKNLGWSPTTPPGEGLKRLIDWFTTTSTLSADAGSGALSKKE